MLLHEFFHCITCKLVAEFNYEVIGLLPVGPELFIYCTFKAYYSGELGKNMGINTVVVSHNMIRSLKKWTKNNLIVLVQKMLSLHCNILLYK